MKRVILGLALLVLSATALHAQVNYTVSSGPMNGRANGTGITGINDSTGAFIGSLAAELPSTPEFTGNILFYNGYAYAYTVSASGTYTSATNIPPVTTLGDVLIGTYNGSFDNSGNSCSFVFDLHRWVHMEGGGRVGLRRVVWYYISYGTMSCTESLF